MKNSMIYKIKTGQDLFSSGSLGYESTFYSDYNVYDEDYVAGLEALEIDLETYTEHITDSLFNMGQEGWDPDLDTDYDVAMESWASIKAFFAKYGNKVSSAFKSLWNKLDKNQRNLDRIKGLKEQSKKKKEELMNRLREKGVSAKEKEILRKQIAKVDGDIKAFDNQISNLETAIKRTAEEAEKARKMEMSKMRNAGEIKDYLDTRKAREKARVAADKAKAKQDAKDAKLLAR